MKTKRNLWPIGVAMTLIVFFGGTIGLVVLASTQRSDLVAANYYEDEVRFQNQIDRSKRTQRLPGHASVDYRESSGQLAIMLPVAGANSPQGTVQLYRPSAAGLDRQFEIQTDTSGTQLIDVHELKAGLWKVKITWSAGGEDFY